MTTQVEIAAADLLESKRQLETRLGKLINDTLAQYSTEIGVRVRSVEVEIPVPRAYESQFTDFMGALKAHGVKVKIDFGINIEI